MNGKAPMNYGFGLIISQMNGRPRIRHTGHVNGFQSELRTLPEEQLPYAFLCNVENFDRNRPGQDEIDALTEAAVDAALRYG
jgi:CubicO group peptidase (beta-lactamase class C family)